MDPNYMQDAFGAPNSSGNLLSQFGDTNSSYDQGGMSGGMGGGSFNPAYAMLGGGLGGMLGGLFGNNQNPATAANQYLNQMPGAISPYMSPYMNAGGAELGNLQQQYGQLTSNPGGMMNQIGQSFHQSPGFQFALNQALTGANRASAAGGLAGAPSNQMQNMQTATQMGNQDYYNWMNHAMGLYGQGLQGEQGMAGMGMQAGTNMANVIANQLSQQAANQYAATQGQNSANNSMWGDLGSIAGAAASIWGG